MSNPGQPSPVNRKARRAYHNAPTVMGLKPFAPTEFYHQQMNEMLDDPDPPVKCDCGRCLPGQDRECPAKHILDPRE